MTEDGICTDFKYLHPAKACTSILVTESGITIAVNLPHPEKVELAITFTESVGEFPLKTHNFEMPLSLLFQFFYLHLKTLLSRGFSLKQKPPNVVTFSSFISWGISTLSKSLSKARNLPFFRVKFSILFKQYTDLMKNMGRSPPKRQNIHFLHWNRSQ